MATGTSERARKPTWREVFSDPVHLLAFGFGAGLSPVGPGTVGSLWGVALAVATPSLGLAWEVGIALLLCVTGVWICGASARRLGVHDSGGIVWDEIAGAYLVFLPLPRTWPWLAAGFVAFRILDIAKPWPIRELDHRLRGGTGIMLDDVVAGLIAAAVLWLVAGAVAP